MDDADAAEGSDASDRFDAFDSFDALDMFDAFDTSDASVPSRVADATTAATPRPQDLPMTKRIQAATIDDPPVSATDEAVDDEPLSARIETRIVAIRGQRVLLDADLARLYGVATRVLVQAVKRNASRFPADFLFRLSDDEIADLRSRSVMASVGHGGRRTAPYAFTEQGVAMLSSVLSSARAIAVNIEIVRTFVRMRALAAAHRDLADRLAALERASDVLGAEGRETRARVDRIWEALEALEAPADPPHRPIGFVVGRDRKREPQDSVDGGGRAGHDEDAVAGGDAGTDDVVRDRARTT